MEKTTDQNARASLRLRLARRVIRQVVRRTARQELENRQLVKADGTEVRWLAPQTGAFLDTLDGEVNRLLARAKLETLPGFGNQLMVEMAAWTVAADRALRRHGISAVSARNTVADLGWRIYRRMLGLTSAPFRLVTRDPGRRLRWTIRTLLIFPFNAPGAPGYEVITRREGDDILTHFTCCPPQSFIRRIAEEDDDADTLETFRQSWCMYDWPGADLIAADGQRGHYCRRSTLSHGDAVCDMCWAARAPGSDTER